jgi:hypothetical protein
MSERTTDPTVADPARSADPAEAPPSWAREHTERLTVALDRLVERGTLNRGQARAVRDEVLGRPVRSGGRTTAAEPWSWATLVTEVGGYLGAAFVAGAAIALVEPRWHELSAGVRALVLGLPGLALLLGAVLVARARPGGWTPRGAGDPRRRTVQVLGLAGVALLTGVVSALVPGQVGSSGHELIVALAALLLTGVGHLLCRGALTQLAAFGATIWTAAGAVDVAGAFDEEIVLGLVWFGVGLLWAVLALTGALDEVAVAITAAGITMFVGAELMIVAGGHPGWEGLGYLLLGVLAAGGPISYVRRREPTALAVGGIALAVVVPQAIIDFTDGALGTSGALLVSGLSIVAASVATFRMHRATRA